jgi:hypothetical protein
MEADATLGSGPQRNYAALHYPLHVETDVELSPAQFPPEAPHPAQTGGAFEDDHLIDLWMHPDQITARRLHQPTDPALRQRLLDEGDDTEPASHITQ